MWLDSATVLPGPSGVVLGLLLAGAVATEVVLLVTVARTVTARLAAGAAGAWAFLGVSLSTAGEGATSLLVLSAVGCATVLLTSVVGARRLHDRGQASAAGAPSGRRRRTG